MSSHDKASRESLYVDQVDLGRGIPCIKGEEKFPILGVLMMVSSMRFAQRVIICHAYEYICFT